MHSLRGIEPVRTPKTRITTLGASQPRCSEVYTRAVAYRVLLVEFARDGGKVQSGGHRTAPLFRKTIEDNYDAFRRFVLEPFSEGFDELKWLERTKEFLGFGQGLATIYLNRVDKERFAIVNNKAVEAMALFDVQGSIGTCAEIRCHTPRGTATD